MDERGNNSNRSSHEGGSLVGIAVSGTSSQHTHILANQADSSDLHMDMTENNKDNKRHLDNLIENGKPSLINLFALVLAMGNAADAVEILCVGFIMSDISSVTRMDKELLSAAVFLGMLFGGIICGYLSDIIGR